MKKQAFVESARNRSLMTAISVLFMFSMIFGYNTPLKAEDTSSVSPAEKNGQNTTTYPVRVEIKETKNRIVEGSVRGHKLYVDQPKEFGADDTAPTPPETLAFALGACVVSTGRLLAILNKLEIRSISATVEGELDFAKALGMQTEKRLGYSGLKVSVKIDSEMTAEEEKKFLADISAHCPMCDNLANATPIAIEAAAK